MTCLIKRCSPCSQAALETLPPSNKNKMTHTNENKMHPGTREMNLHYNQTCNQCLPKKVGTFSWAHWRHGNPLRPRHGNPLRPPGKFLSPTLKKIWAGLRPPQPGIGIFFLTPHPAELGPTDTTCCSASQTPCRMDKTTTYLFSSF